jgi:hypothetical protein
MNFIYSLFTMLLLLLNVFHASSPDFKFLANRKQLEHYTNHSDVVVIASPGRSGSTLLTDVIYQSGDIKTILKTHLLPPDKKFKGKIIFIFSNPDLAAESALHMTISDPMSGFLHFHHLETSDKTWLQKIGKTTEQTLQENLLSYDALGTYDQLNQWLYVRSKPSLEKKAQILAVKYENLWDEKTQRAIKSFLNLKTFALPPRKMRGCDKNSMDQKELLFREKYNLGSDENPKYNAYARARILWETAPPFQFLEMVD